MAESFTKYNKLPLTFEEQLRILKNRGLIIADEKRAITYLQQINYYRLSAYFLPYQAVKDVFNDGTTFEQIVETYAFDRELRLLIFDCIERIEVAIRTQITYHMSTSYCNSHWQDDRYLFVEPFTSKKGNLKDPYNDFQKIILKAKENERSEIFIRHYVSHYQQPTNPPSWMCIELLTIGELSNLFTGLKQSRDKIHIADFFKLRPEIFASWLHTLTYVRNICAHHARLWNREFAVSPIIPKNKLQADWVGKQYTSNNRRTFYFLCVLKYLLNRSNLNNGFTTKLEALYSKYPTVPIQYIGIPSDRKGNMLNWRSEPLFV